MKEESMAEGLLWTDRKEGGLPLLVKEFSLEFGVSD